MHQLVGLSLALAVAKASDALGLSLEMGAFAAGVAVSAGGGEAAERVLASLGAVRNVFQSLFLTCIGMLLNGPFLLTHLRALLLCVSLIVLAKTGITCVVVRAYGYSHRTALLVGLSLAQVGEFAFVLLSRASALRLIQRPAYLLLLGTTALSLLFTPLLFKAQAALLSRDGWRGEAEGRTGGGVGSGGSGVEEFSLPLSSVLTPRAGDEADGEEALLREKENGSGTPVRRAHLL
jgi:Kef-type K+ transport system membrane component KefB